MFEVGMTLYVQYVYVYIQSMYNLCIGPVRNPQLASVCFGCGELLEPLDLHSVISTSFQRGTHGASLHN